MKGKAGLMIGLAAGYVVGSRAGRGRYEQIKAQAQKVWSCDPVQSKVDVVKGLAKSAAGAVPGAVWDGAVKATKAVTKKGSASDRGGSASGGAEGASDVKDTAERKVEDLAQQATAAVDDAQGVGRGF